MPHDVTDGFAIESATEFHEPVVLEQAHLGNDVEFILHATDVFNLQDQPGAHLVKIGEPRRVTDGGAGDATLDMIGSKKRVSKAEKIWRVS